MAAVAKIPPLMNWPLARRFCQAGYAIRRAIWDGTGDYELAWITYGDALFWHLSATGKRVCRGSTFTSSAGTTVAVRGDVIEEDLLAQDWTVLPVGCDFSSDCPCGDKLALIDFPGFPVAGGSGSVALANPNALTDCAAPVLDFSDCDCYTPPAFGGETPPLPEPAGPNGGAAPDVVKKAAATGGDSGGGAGGSESGTGEDGAAPAGGGGFVMPWGVQGAAPGGGGGPPSPPKPCRNVHECPPNEQWDNGRCKCVPKPAEAPRCVITLTRDSDAAVPCVDDPVLGEICPPEVQPLAYSWFGTLEFIAPGNANTWSVTIRRSGLDGGEVIWTGNMEDGDTHDFEVTQPSPIVPGGCFSVTATANEFGGDGTASGSQNACVPACDPMECSPPICPTPEFPEGLTCPPGELLDTEHCVCYPEPICDGNQHWSASQNRCCYNTDVVVDFWCDGTTLVEEKADGDCGTVIDETPGHPSCAE